MTAVVLVIAELLRLDGAGQAGVVPVVVKEMFVHAEKSPGPHTDLT
jgi:hypothetical protein